jgi:hypothetical protein
MENPYKFDTKNHRVVINVNRSNNVYLGTGALYLTSLYLYSRRFLRVDGNGVAAGAFAAFSLPAAYAYARFFLSDAETEAAKINNAREGVE